MFNFRITIIVIKLPKSQYETGVVLKYFNNYHFSILPLQPVFQISYIASDPIPLWLVCRNKKNTLYLFILLSIWKIDKYLMVGKIQILGIQFIESR